MRTIKVAVGGLGYLLCLTLLFHHWIMLSSIPHSAPNISIETISHDEIKLSERVDLVSTNVQVEPAPCSYMCFDLTEDEIWLLAELIYYEGRGESIECQLGIGSVVLTRLNLGGYKSLSEVIFDSGQFSTAKKIGRTDRSKMNVQYSVAYYLAVNGLTLPDYVWYFRSGHYHTMKDAEDYKKIDHTYFSTSKKMKELLTGDNYDTCNTESR